MKLFRSQKKKAHPKITLRLILMGKTWLIGFGRPNPLPENLGKGGF